MTELRLEFPLALLLKVAGMARSTYYYQCKVAAAGDPDAELKAQIRAIFDQHKRRYGYRRITAVLRFVVGLAINHKVVQRLMQVLGLKSVVRPKKYRSYRGENHVEVPNLLKREFTADKPNQKWTTDVTEFKVKGKKLFLSTVMDLYNGEIVAYEMRDRPDYPLVGRMLAKALKTLEGKQAPLLHSDQGWHYKMPAYRKMLAEKGIKQSMSRKGNCLDNAAMESFFATLKTELFYTQDFFSTTVLGFEVYRYINYYNFTSINSRLNGLSPLQYRTRAMELAG